MGNLLFNDMGCNVSCNVPVFIKTKIGCAFPELKRFVATISPELQVIPIVHNVDPSSNHVLALDHTTRNSKKYVKNIGLDNSSLLLIVGDIHQAMAAKDIAADLKKEIVSRSEIVDEADLNDTLHKIPKWDFEQTLKDLCTKHELF